MNDRSKPGPAPGTLGYAVVHFDRVRLMTRPQGGEVLADYELLSGKRDALRLMRKGEPPPMSHGAREAHIDCDGFLALDGSCFVVGVSHG